MMNGGATAPKENANPIIHQVESKDINYRKRQKPLGWSIIERYAFSGSTHKDVSDDNDDDAWMEETDDATTAANMDWNLIRTAQDHAIYRGLVDVSIATNGKAVAVLRSVGFHHVPITSTTLGNHNLPTPSPPLAFIPTDNNMSTTLTASWKDPIPTPTSSQLLEVPRCEAVDANEIFEIIRNIQDPEHPLTLEQLGVVSRNQIQVYDHTFELLQSQQQEQEQSPNNPKVTETKQNASTVDVRFTPTIPHCSMATLIGLCIQVKLLRSLPNDFKITVRIQPGTHASELAVNKQLADKERVCAAMENASLVGVVNRCIANGMRGEMQ